jgi:hypothetical protein
MRTDNTDSFCELKRTDTQWMDQKGEIHNIKDMDLWHIYNTVEMLKRRNLSMKILRRDLFEIPDLMIERLETEFAEKYPEYLI